MSRLTIKREISRCEFNGTQPFFFWYSCCFFDLHFDLILGKCPDKILHFFQNRFRSYFELDRLHDITFTQSMMPLYHICVSAFPAQQSQTTENYFPRHSGLDPESPRHNQITPLPRSHVARGSVYRTLQAMERYTVFEIIRMYSLENVEISEVIPRDRTISPFKGRP